MTLKIYFIIVSPCLGLIMSDYYFRCSVYFNLCNFHNNPMRWSYYHNNNRTETQEKHLFQSHAARKYETQYLNQGILALELVPYCYFLTWNLF